MPISEKILHEINVLETEDQMKNLMKDILKLEDDGVKRWNVQYESKINDYLGVTEDEVAEEEQ